MNGYEKFIFFICLNIICFVLLNWYAFKSNKSYEWVGFMKSGFNKFFVFMFAIPFFILGAVAMLYNIIMSLKQRG
jgi:hypothetical protein